jgi:hypothetical protein
MANEEPLCSAGFLQEGNRPRTLEPLVRLDLLEQSRFFHIFTVSLGLGLDLDLDHHGEEVGLLQQRGLIVLLQKAPDKNFFGPSS